jgi:hypothetical protein
MFPTPPPFETQPGAYPPQQDAPFLPPGAPYGGPPQGDPNLIPQPAIVKEGAAPETIPREEYRESDYKQVGKKKALLIGINYFQTPNQLHGCINDVKNIKEFLISRGFKDEPSSMIVLTDDQPSKLPLKSNILSSCEWLVKDAEPGDSLFFHYSGHGEQVADKKKSRWR